MKLKLLSFIGFLSFILSGCTTDVYNLGGGLYSVHSTGAGISPSGVTESVYETANDFAKKEDKKVFVEKIEVRPGAFARNPPEATLTFSLVEKDSQELKNNKLIPDLQKVQIIKNGEKPNDDISVKLDNLNKLYESSLITKEEYDRKRKELLDNF